jgi:hypothetical protein
MSAGPGAIPPPLPRPPNREWQALLYVLVGIALAGAITIASLVYFLRPKAHRTEARPLPIEANPDAPVMATDLYIGADDFVVDIFHNGHRVPDEARKVNSEVYGAIGERTTLTVREGDWLVFNVANNRLRWSGAYYFGIAGVTEDGSVAFVSEESDRWSVCEDPGQVPRFIADSKFLADNKVQRIEKPWSGGDKMLNSKVKGWAGYAIWGSPTNRNIWAQIPGQAGEIRRASGATPVAMHVGGDS